MDDLVCINGEFVPSHEAKISVFDRGFLFADAVYEVTSVLHGQLIDNKAHLERLRRSLSELGMPSPLPLAEIEALQQTLVAKNQLVEGTVYLQISRGPAPRDFAYPTHTKPTLVMFSQTRSLVDNPKAETGISIVTTADIRWGRRDIKTVGLLPASMAKQYALNQGADDAWFVESGVVTEGTSNNAFIVDNANQIITRQLGNEILAGITRKAVLDLCAKQSMTLIERPFTIDEAREAKEAFVTSASTFVLPVVMIDQQKIGTGQPGPVAKGLRETYLAFALGAGG